MYIYEMHQHTAGCSRCGIDGVEKTVLALKRDGFAGMVLTNHCYHGNTGIDRNLPWDEFCRAYEESYNQAVKIGNAIDFKVFFGLEHSVGEGKEVLIYGITPEFMYNTLELKRMDLGEISGLVHKAGGVLFQAHPYRHRDYILDPDKPINPKFVDGFEAFNSCNSLEENLKAKKYAESLNMPQIAGSDAHIADFKGRFGIECERKLETTDDLLFTLKSGSYKLHIPGVSE